MKNLVRSAVAISLAAGLLLGQGPKELKPGWNLFSKAQDVQLGKEAAAQVEQKMQVVRDPALNNYVATIGKKLVAAPEAGDYPYSFKVVNDPNINAFALPGGPTFVHTGLIKAADNEAQLAGVMAHEIAHVALRHGTNQASKANAVQIPAMILGGALGNNGSMLGQLAQVGVGLGANSVLMKFSRTAEDQADRLGARMLARAGYNPIEMARFFEKLEASGGSRGPSFLSSHPNPGNRARAIEEEIRFMPQRNFSETGSGDLNEIKGKLGALPAAKGGGQAVAMGDGDPRPASQTQQYDGGYFSIAHPANWEVMGGKEGASVTIAPRSGLARDQDGGVGVGYGLIASRYSAHGGNGTLRSDTDDLVGQLSQSNPAMQVGGQRRNTKVGSANALVTTLYNQSPLNGGREINMLVTVDRPDDLFYMIFIAPENDFKTVQTTFEQMLRSVRFR